MKDFGSLTRKIPVDEDLKLIEDCLFKAQSLVEELRITKDLMSQDKSGLQPAYRREYQELLRALNGILVY